jgi:hypothetical protein
VRERLTAPASVLLQELPMEPRQELPQGPERPTAERQAQPREVVRRARAARRGGPAQPAMAIAVRPAGLAPRAAGVTRVVCLAQPAVAAAWQASPQAAAARKVVRSTAAAQPAAVERRVAAAEQREWRVAAERPAAVAAAQPGALLAVAAAGRVLLPAVAAEQRDEPRAAAAEPGARQAAAVAGLGAQRAAAVRRALLPEAAAVRRALPPAVLPFSSLLLRPSSSVLRSAPASAAPVRTSAPYLAGGSARPRTAYPAWRPGWRPWWPRGPPLWRCKQAGAILRNS